jgi:hypothetical protein
MSAGGFVDLKIDNDVELELGLAKKPGAMSTLGYLADHGGEVPWNWDNIKPATRELVADLIVAGLVVEREYVTHALQTQGRLALRLTDKGRNVIEIHRRRKVTAGKVTEIPKD